MGKKETECRCSFCGRSEREVGYPLLSGYAGYICVECAEQASIAAREIKQKASDLKLGLEELPKPTRMIACDNGLSCKLNFQQQGSVIQSLFEFEMKHAIFPATQYKDLRALYGFLTDLCNSQIVIKKP